MSFRNNQHAPVKVATSTVAIDHNHKVFETPEMKKIFKGMQDDLSGFYKELSSKYQIMTGKQDIILAELLKFNAFIGDTTNTLKLIGEIQKSLAKFASQVINAPDKTELQHNLNLLQKLRTAQSEKKLDTMPSISIIKSYMENIEKLIDDAHSYANEAFANYENEKSKALDSVAISADKFRTKCAEAHLLADLRANLREKQIYLDTIEIPQCEAAAQKAIQTQSNKPEKGKLTEVSINTSGTKQHFFSVSSSTDKPVSKSEDLSKQAVEKEKAKSKSIFSTNKSKAQPVNPALVKDNQPSTKSNRK